MKPHRKEIKKKERDTKIKNKKDERVLNWLRRHNFQLRSSREIREWVENYLNIVGNSPEVKERLCLQWTKTYPRGISLWNFIIPGTKTSGKKVKNASRKIKALSYSGDNKKYNRVSPGGRWHIEQLSLPPLSFQRVSGNKKSSRVVVVRMKEESDFRNILKIELEGFADCLAISCERKRSQG